MAGKTEEFAVFATGTSFALTRCMVLRIGQPAIAAGSDGTVLINMVDTLPALLRDRLREALGGQSNIFVGVPLSQRQAVAVIAKLDDAAAEASAQVLGAAQRPVKARKARR